MAGDRAWLGHAAGEHRPCKLHVSLTLIDPEEAKTVALELLQDLVRDFTPEEFRALDKAGAMDWRFVEGEKRYIRSFAETL